MRALLRSLLYLYPAAYRAEYGEEMRIVLEEVQTQAKKTGPLAQALSFAREAAGLVHGALEEHAHGILFPQDFSFIPQRRLSMRSEFRFPKAAVALMSVILAAVVVAIDKAKAISVSAPHASLPMGPIQPLHYSVISTLLITLAGLGVCGVLLWAVLFALHRSGTQRLSDLNPSASPRPGKTILS